jgi:hypothetical protein
MLLSWEIEEQKVKLKRLKKLGKGLKNKSGWRLEVAEQEALILKLKEKQKKPELEDE